MLSTRGHTGTGGNTGRPTPTQSLTLPGAPDLQHYQHWAAPRLLLRGVAVRSDQSERFLPLLKFPIQGPQGQVGGLHTSHCMIYAALTHTEEGALPSPPCTSTRAWGGASSPAKGK